MGFGRMGARGGFGAVGRVSGTHGSAAAAWTPLNLGAALLAWWDPADTANMTFGTGVQFWNDKIGGRTAAQNTAASQPTWSATARNGKPGLIFNAASLQWFNFIPTGFPTGNNISTMFVSAFNNNAANVYMLDYGTQAIQQLRAMANATTTFFAQGLDGANTTSAGTTQNIDFGLYWQFGAGASSLALNGATAVTSTPPTQATTTTGGTIGNWLGGGTAQLWNGVIKQILVCSGALTFSQQQKIEGWESWVDGLAGANLPGGHPYKSRPPLVADP